MIDIQKFNEKCLHFLGYRKETIPVHNVVWVNSLGEMLYHPDFSSDWNNIMKVVEAIERKDDSVHHYRWNGIEEIEYNNFMGYEVEICKNYCYISMALNLDPERLLAHTTGGTKTENLVKAIDMFLDWHKNYYPENKQ